MVFDLHLQGRIKKIMQSDEEVGKVAQAVPIIIYILFNGQRQCAAIPMRMPSAAVRVQ